MNSAFPSLKNQGLTLVELLIAITLAMFLFCGCVGFLFHVKQRVIVHQGAAIIQENARFLASFFENIVHFSGFLGCQRISEKAILTLHPPLTEPDVGWELRKPVKKVQLKELEKNRFVPKSVKERAVAGCDMLWVNTLNDPHPILAVETTAVQVSGQFPIKSGQMVSVFDCGQNDILILTSDPLFIPRKGSTLNIAAHQLGKQYGQQAFVAAFSSSLYYVGKTKRENVLALYRTDLLGRTQEIIEGIEDFKITIDDKTIRLSVLLCDPKKQVQSRWFHYVFLI